MAYALTQAISAIRRTSAPLVAICTIDSPSTMQSIKLLFQETTPLAVWDVVQGVQQLTSAGVDIVQALSPKGNPTNPVELLKNAMQLPPKSLLFVMNMHLFFAQPGTIQGLANLRDVLKSRGATLVLLSPAMKLPLELSQDIIVLEEPLPDAKALGRVISGEVSNFYKSTDVALDISSDAHTRSVDALRGLGPFAAEAEVAMALSKDGLDVPRLWQRKQQVIAQTPGLSVYKGTERYDSIGGLAVLKEYLTSIIHGKYRIKAVIFVDEVDKALAGMHGDNTGVSQDIHGTLLTHMEEKQMPALLLLGPPGVGKSAIAKTTGNEAGVPTIMLDLAGLKEAHVGASERNIRQALKVIDAISDGHALMIATCNNIAILPPELQRRFKLGRMFVDLPDTNEQEAIWHAHLSKYPSLEDKTRPSCAQWTGADIAQCVQLAYNLDISLVTASKYIVPVAISAQQDIERLRSEAAGRYLSASYYGVYRQPQHSVTNGTRQYSL